MFKPMRESGLFAVNVAESALPVSASPPPVAATVLVVFVFVPAVAPVTVTVIVQLSPPTSEPPERTTEFPPLTTRLLPTPHTSFVVPFVAVNPAGQPAPESLKLILLKAVVAFGLVIVKLMVDISFARIELLLNDFTMVGGAITVRGDVPYPVEVILGPVCVDVMGLLVFVYEPATLPRTLTEMVQFALADNVAPLTLIRVVPEAAVVVPPVSVPVVQAVVKPLGVAINNPVGKVSENPTPVSELALGLVSVNRNTLLFPC